MDIKDEKYIGVFHARIMIMDGRVEWSVDVMNTVKAADFLLDKYFSGRNKEKDAWAFYNDIEKHIFLALATKDN